MPFAALLLAGLVQLGAIAGDQLRLWHAAREAARAAVVDPSRSVTSDAAARGGLSPVAMTITPAPTERVAGAPLTVRLSYKPDSGVPLLGRVLSGLELHASATMRIESP